MAATFERGDRVRIREAALGDAHRDFEIHQHPGLPIGSEGLVLEHAAVSGRADGREELFLVEWDGIGASTYISGRHLELSADGEMLTYTYDATDKESGIDALLMDLSAAGIRFKDLQTSESSLEDIFVNLVGQRT